MSWWHYVTVVIFHDVVPFYICRQYQYTLKNTKQAIPVKGTHHQNHLFPHLFVFQMLMSIDFDRSIRLNAETDFLPTC